MRCTVCGFEHDINAENLEQCPQCAAPGSASTSLLLFEGLIEGEDVVSPLGPRLDSLTSNTTFTTTTSSDLAAPVVAPSMPRIPIRRIYGILKRSYSDSGAKHDEGASTKGIQLSQEEPLDLLSSIPAVPPVLKRLNSDPVTQKVISSKEDKTGNRQSIYFHLSHHQHHPPTLIVFEPFTLFVAGAKER